MNICAQKSTEIARFLKLLGRLECTSYLEVGAREGDTFLHIGSTMEKAVAIDLPGVRWGSQGSESQLLRRTHDLNKRLGVDATTILGDSKDPEIIARARRLGPYDAVFIDGDHSFAGVLADFENYREMSIKVVAFHDILGNREDGVEVDRFWEQVRSDSSIEFCETWSDPPMGIGVLLV